MTDLCSESETFAFDRYSAEPFTSLDYTEEYKLKNAALKLFWHGNRLPGNPGKLIAARQPRAYRTNSKRRAEYRNNRFYLIHPGMREAGTRIVLSPLEPAIHSNIYKALDRLFSARENSYAARLLNFVILRGTDRIALILNVSKLDGTMVRILRRMVETLRNDIPELFSAFLYLDETKSKYYLESKRPEKGVGFKKLFGPAFLDTTLPDGNRLLYPPTAFSQVNETMIPEFLTRIRELLNPEKQTRLIDLYCGYGLIALSMAPEVNSVVGMEIDGPAVDAAEANAKHLYPGKNIRFLRGEIGPAVLKHKLPKPEENELIVLDPPRSGTANGVISELVKRGAERVLHIFCGIDTIPDAVAQWTAKNYSIADVRALDLFPGTPNLEIMVLLKKNPEKK